MNSNFSELENRINYIFQNKNLLLLALTHPSYANENKICKIDTNQRLEFLGDAVLELISSDFLYNNFSDYNEGELTKIRARLVCESNLADVARDLNLYKYLLTGKGENQNDLKANNSTMCDTLESVIGAIFKDGGIEKSKKFILEHILTEENLHKSNHDFKSLLQEISNKNNSKLEYRLISETGPDHNKIFQVAVYLNDEKIGVGTGKSKKEAEQFAAEIGIKSLRNQCI